MTAQQAEYVLVSIEAEDETDTEITALRDNQSVCSGGATIGGFVADLKENFFDDKFVD